MRFDRAVYDRLTDDEKAAYVAAVRDAGSEPGAAPPDGIAPEKATSHEGFEVVDDDPR